MKVKYCVKVRKIVFVKKCVCVCVWEREGSVCVQERDGNSWDLNIRLVRERERECISSMFLGFGGFDIQPTCAVVTSRGMHFGFEMREGDKFGPRKACVNSHMYAPIC